MRQAGAAAGWPKRHRCAVLYGGLNAASEIAEADCWLLALLESIGLPASLV
jgi:hypothetical protein